MPFGVEPLVLFLLLRAFASGSVALTGVEAIANGVPAFKPPEAKNAADTMIAMAVLLGVIFIGVTDRRERVRHRPVDRRRRRRWSRSSPAHVYGDGHRSTALFLVATMLILFLAANTSYNAFPRLAAILAEDGYMPRQFAFRGDRLAYSWGIVLLAGVAIALLVALRRHDHPAHPALRASACSCASPCADRDGPALAADSRSGLAVAARRSTRSARS